MAKKQDDMFKIYVCPEVKAEFLAICKQHDLKIGWTASMIYGWFTRQDQAVRALILQLVPESLTDGIAKIAAERIDFTYRTARPGGKAAKGKARQSADPTVQAVRKIVQGGKKRPAGGRRRSVSSG